MQFWSTQSGLSGLMCENTPRLHFTLHHYTFIRGNRATNEFSELVYEREGGTLPLALWRLPFVHYHRHAVGQFRPVRV